METMRTPRTPDELAAEKSAQRKVLAWIALILAGLFGFIYWSKIEGERRAAEAKIAAAEAEKACMQEPRCSDDAARKFSSSKSEPIVSPATGALFYRGMPCTDDCSGHIAGYEWASDLGVTNADACPDGRGDSFRHGCEAAAEETLWIIRNNE